MRIIGGIHKGRRIKAPLSLTDNPRNPVRPTTDFAKEALFNTLIHRIDFESCEALDLFAGTGNMSYEMASRGAEKVLAVDQNSRCCAFINKTKTDLQLNIRVLRADVLNYLKRGSKKTEQGFDLIFADPPYDLPELAMIPNLVLNNNWLSKTGLFVLEHGKEHSFKENPSFLEERKYGHVHFSFFKSK